MRHNSCAHSVDHCGSPTKTKSSLSKVFRFNIGVYTLCCDRMTVSLLWRRPRRFSERVSTENECKGSACSILRSEGGLESPIDRGALGIISNPILLLLETTTVACVVYNLQASSSSQLLNSVYSYNLPTRVFSLGASLRGRVVLYTVLAYSSRRHVITHTKSSELLDGGQLKKKKENNTRRIYNRRERKRTRKNMAEPLKVTRKRISM